MTLFLLFATGTMSYSQSWLEQVGRTAVRRAKNRAVQKVEDKIYQGVDKAVDKAFEKTEDAIENAAEKEIAEAEERKAAADSMKAAQKAEEQALEQARRKKESEARRQQVLDQFAGRAASGEAPFYMAKEGMEVTYAVKDAKGRVTSYTKTAIVSLDYSDSRNFTVETATELYSDKMELMMSTPMTSKATVKDGVVTFDPESMAGQLTAGMEVAGDFFFVPDNIEVGDILMDYRVEITIGPMKTEAENTDVHVSGRETLEISGRRIDCYIIESKVSAKALGIKSESIQKVWYGRGIGQVKSEAYTLKGKLQSANEIVEIKGL